MDDLLLKTVRFFFVPEAALSVLFLLAFIVMFLLGIKWRKYCQRELTALQEHAVDDYAQLQNKLTPQAFLRIRLSALADVENRLEELPGTFINVGILATFLGLGVAIQGAADLLQESVTDLTRLTEVLSVIAFKFQTSVWGICFSLVFQKFFVDTYFSARQDLIDELTETLFATEGDGIRALLATQNQLFEKQLALQQEAETRLQETETKRQEAVGQALAKTFEAFERISHRIETWQNEAALQHMNSFEALKSELGRQSISLQIIAGNIAKFIESAEAFAKNTTIFAHMTKEFQDETKKLKESVHAIHDTVEKNIRTSRETFEKVQEDFLEELKSNRESTNRFLEASQKQLLCSEEDFAERSQQAFEKMLRAQLGQVHNEYMTETKHVHEAIRRLSGVLHELEQHVAEMKQVSQVEAQQATRLQKSAALSLSNVASQLSKAIQDDFLARVQQQQQEKNSRQKFYDDMKRAQTDHVEALKSLEMILLSSQEEERSARKASKEKLEALLETLCCTNEEQKKLLPTYTANIKKVCDNPAYARQLLAALENLAQAQTSEKALLAQKLDGIAEIIHTESTGVLPKALAQESAQLQALITEKSALLVQTLKASAPLLPSPAAASPSSTSLSRMSAAISRSAAPTKTPVAVPRSGTDPTKMTASVPRSSAASANAPAASPRSSTDPLRKSAAIPRNDMTSRR